MFNWISEVYTSSEESGGGEDSDEDIITDYLSPLDDNGNLDAAVTSSSSPGVVSSASAIHFYTTESSLRISAEDMEPTGAASSSAGEATDESNYVTTTAAAESIPIISVTQHSPAASKAFFILGKMDDDELREGWLTNSTKCHPIIKFKNLAGDGGKSDLFFFGIRDTSVWPKKLTELFCSRRCGFV